MDSSFWQTTLPSVRDRSFYALNNSLFCDVEFSVVDSSGDKVNIPVHKYVLAISSPVFQAMFYGQLAETRQVVDLPDCTKEGLEELLHYVYTDEVNLTESNVMEVMLLADKYMLPFLVERCNHYLRESLKPEDVFTVLPQVQNTANKKAFYLCWDIIDTYTQRAVTSQPFLNISRELLCEVLAREWLHIEEIDLFHAADRWASFQIKNKKNPKAELVEGGRKRNELGEEAVHLIRFPVMSQKEFASYVLPSDILIKSEIVEIMQAFSGIEARQEVFKCERRIGQHKERWSEVRFCHDESSLQPMSFRTRKMFLGETNIQGPICIDLLVNKRVSLAGVRLIGFHNRQYQVNIEIYRANDPYTILYQSIGHQHYTTGEELIDGLYPGFTVMIHPPVKLEPDVCYTIDADIRGPPYPQCGRVDISVYPHLR
ncbi:BTB/POZ domain-containing protein 6-like [Actinia tenebrosa]|uniref:BTB/POZ domain-containing protein 6-like n=1 Tax=Actinia tenebrosa TaxID=6105 RepID=A0A6P8IXR5_ACTTE|nr:BTB/POZ domain-containing protein 6-like [Actinia tenebrosa]